MQFQGGSMQSHFRKYLPHLSQFHSPAVYVPSFDEIHCLIEVANSHESTQAVGDLAYIVASSGLRMAELASLRVTDIVSDLGLVQIESQHQTTTRYVPVSLRTLRCLASLHARFPDSELVFGDRSRSFLQTLLRKFHSLAVKIGAERMLLHSLRCAMLENLSVLAKTDQELAAIQYLAGHVPSSPESDLDFQTILEIAKRLFEKLWSKLDAKKA
ncbi:MAG: tyrosine-type recombinase/integrase [Terriglobales bacterium]